MTAARIETKPAPRVVSRQQLFTVPSDFFGLSNSLATNYDVAADG